MADPRMILMCLGLILIGAMVISKIFVDWVFDWYWPEQVEASSLAGILQIWWICDR